MEAVIKMTVPAVRRHCSLEADCGRSLAGWSISDPVYLCKSSGIDMCENVGKRWKWI